MVKLSELLEPVSLAVARSGADGLAGAVKSTVNGVPSAVALLPAASVTVILGVYVPAGNVFVAEMLQLPLASAVVL